MSALRVAVVGVRVSLPVSLGSWKRETDIHLRGEGDGSKECEVLLAGRVKDSQRVGRYRVGEMSISAPDPLLKGWTTEKREEPLRPPLVFRVLKGEDAPPPPAGEPEKPNWGFAGRDDPADP